MSPERKINTGGKFDIIVGKHHVKGEESIASALDMPGFQPPSDLQALRSNYLEHLRNTYYALDFKGIPQLDTISRQLPLEEVYVPLVARPEMPSGETWERRLAGRTVGLEVLPEEALASLKSAEAPLPVEQAMAKHSQVVVLGDPGSGKTTLLKHLALRLAAESGAPLPILLPLNAYAAALLEADLNLEAYLPQYFAGLAQGLTNLRLLFETAIAQGQAVILLDGLDEVQSDRNRLAHKVEAFAREASKLKNKIVVTSRIVGYRESPLQAKTWTLYTLLDFDRQAIDQFAARWCLAFERSTLGDTPEAQNQAETERKALLEAIESNPGVEALASNPLLLTILALIKRQGVTLPDHRVQLYELYLKTLIEAWSKARSLAKRPVGPPMNYLKTVTILGPLALRLREENPTAGLVPEELLIDWLTEYFEGEDWGFLRGEAQTHAQEFLASVREYSNLLVERGQGRFGFLHLTFEEALAARGPVQKGQLDLEDSLSVIRSHLTDPTWRETILLAVGIWGLVREQKRVAGEVVRAMLEMDCGKENPCRNVLMAGACLEDVGELGLGRLATAEVIESLLKTSRNRSLPPTVQRDAGFSLGRCGWRPPDIDEFMEIPGGDFLYGDEKEKRTIEKPFNISKYPVTNLQYRQFIEDHGYERGELWSAEGWSWRTGLYDSKVEDDRIRGWLSNRPLEKRSETFFWHDPRFNNPLAPVVGISWFESEAYCNWLNNKLRRPVRLPTEQEWERAARGVDGFDYPWGDDFDRNKTNCAEFWSSEQDLSEEDKWRDWFGSDTYRQASTTIIGQFPNGNSLSGVSDMSGNVWEWTDSWYDLKHTGHVLRGGSWYNHRENVRCALRGWGVPVSFFVLVGFRVVSPGSISGI